MKVVSWRTLLITILGCGYAIYKAVILIMGKGELIDIIWIVVLGRLVIKGFKSAFSEEAHKDDQRKAMQSKRVYRKLFGKWAPVMPWGGLILFALAGVCVILLHDSTALWMMGIFLLLALIYSVWLFVVVSKHLEMDEIQLREEEYAQRHAHERSGESI